MKNLQSVILTLQYCLETFEQSCQCGRCDPCTRGQGDLREAIQTVEDLQRSSTEQADRGGSFPERTERGSGEGQTGSA